MGRFLIGFMTMVLIIACQNEKNTVDGAEELKKPSQRSKDLLTDMSKENLQGFKWMNQAGAFDFSGKILKVKAGKATDFFNNPEDKTITATAPYLYREVSGDFVARAQVKPDFSSMWNAAALMVHLDSLHWIKFAFENSDATGRSIVSVVTRGVSDDANGAILHNRHSIWLQISRKNDLFAMHWSENGRNFKMARLAALPDAETVKIGMEAQCPVGEGAEHEFLFFSLEQRTVSDIRKGI